MEKLLRKHEDLAQAQSNCETMTVMQWNVLADGLAQNGDFERVRDSPFRLDCLPASAEWICTSTSVCAVSSECSNACRCHRMCLHGSKGHLRLFRRLQNPKPTSSAFRRSIATVSICIGCSCTQLLLSNRLFCCSCTVHHVISDSRMLCVQRTSSGRSLRGWDTLASSGPRPARQQSSTATHAMDAPCSSGLIDFISQVLPKVRLGLPEWCAMKLWPEARRACCQLFTAPAACR